MTAHCVVETTIDAPCEHVFDVVHDYSQRLEWDTLLRKAYVVGSGAPAVGVVTVCQARRSLGGLAFATRYVTFNRPKVAAVTLTKPYFVFAKWSASIRHTEVAPKRSDVTYTLTFRCRPRWLARPIEAIALRMFRAETQRRLRALKAYIEGGFTI